MISPISSPTVRYTPSTHPYIGDLLSPEVLSFLGKLHERFEPRRQQLLRSRDDVQGRMDAGVKFEFPERTAHVRSAEWKVTDVPPSLRDKSIELIVEPKMRSLQDGAQVGAPIMIADFEDATSPTWSNITSGHWDVKSWIANQSGEGSQSVIMIRPRALHCDESHFWINEGMISASLFDFGLFFFHSAHLLVEYGSGPFLYLSKLEHYREARWWNDLFLFAQEYFGIDSGTIKATVTVETIPAIFQIDEMLYELRDHSSGLSCGLQNYLFSFVKHFGTRPTYILPDRDTLSFQNPFLNAYGRHIIQVAHRRGTKAVGVTSNDVPDYTNDTLLDELIDRVLREKESEMLYGFDSSRVAHPSFIAPLLKQEKERVNSGNSRLASASLRIGVNDLLNVSGGPITEKQVRKHIYAGLVYTAGWLSGQGVIAISGRLEDKTGAEIARAQLWQWLHAKVRLTDGQVFDEATLDEWFEQESQKVRSILSGNFDLTKYVGQSSEVFLHIVKEKNQTSFLTDLVYPMLVNKA